MHGLQCEAAHVFVSQCAIAHGLKRLLYVFIDLPLELVFVLGIQFFELLHFRL